LLAGERRCIIETTVCFMRIQWRLAAGQAAVLVVVTAGCQRRQAQPDPLPGFPRIMLWAWERPEDLQFLDPHAAGVAFLARTVSWRGAELHSRPRFQPLRVPPIAALMAVVRLESGGTPPDVAGAAAEAASAAGLPGVRALQIDFDAKESERRWYIALIARVRALLPPSMPLEITALESWCMGDGWIRGLPVSDAVPMLFRMGSGEAYGGGDFRIGLCRSAVGVSTDELPESWPRGRRLFVFNPHPWTEETYRGALRLQGR